MQFLINNAFRNRTIEKYKLEGSAGLHENEN